MKSLEKKIILSAQGLIVLSAALSGLIMFRNYTKSIDLNVKDKLRSAVYAAESAYDYTKVKSLFEANMERSNYHLDGVRKMIHLKGKLGVEYLYGLIKNEKDEWVYIFDDSYFDYEDDEDPFLYPLDGDWDTLELSVATKELQIDSEYTEDEWGVLISAVLPLLDDNGDVYMVLGADFEASDTQNLKLRTFFILVFAVVVATVISSIVAFVLSRSLTKPVINMQKSLNDMAQGHGDLTVRLKDNRMDELGEMARSYNHFLESMVQIITNIKWSIKENREVKTDFGKNIDKTVKTLQEVNNSLSTSSDNMVKLKEILNDSSNAVTDIIKNLNELNSFIEDQAGATEQSTAAITQMVASLKNIASIVNKKEEATKDLVERSKNGRSSFNKTRNEFVNSVVSQIDEISKTAKIISNISSRTNLLSMNAAIEAAHAGESGKGFAVVADEIRKLAEVSSKNSSDISKILKDIVTSIEVTSNNFDSTSKVFSLIENEVVSVDEALKEINSATQELSEGGDQILTAMTVLNDSSQQVKSGSNEIRSNSNYLLDVDKQSKDISSSVKDSLEITGANISELKLDVKESLKLTKKLDVSAENIDKEVSKFKLDS